MDGYMVMNNSPEVWPEIESGAIRPLIHRTFPIENAADAHAVLEHHENIGKVVLTVQ